MIVLTLVLGDTFLQTQDNLGVWVVDHSRIFPLCLIWRLSGPLVSMTIQPCLTGIQVLAPFFGYPRRAIWTPLTVRNISRPTDSNATTSPPLRTPMRVVIVPVAVSVGFRAMKDGYRRIFNFS